MPLSDGPAGGFAVNLKDIAERLSLDLLTPELANGPWPDVTRGFASDLLSDVLAHAPVEGLLVTLQTHLNAVAVASHAQLAAVVFTGGRRPDTAVRRKAVEEEIILFGSRETTFDLVGRLYVLGLRGPSS